MNVSPVEVPQQTGDLCLSLAGMSAAAFPPMPCMDVGESERRRRKVAPEKLPDKLECCFVTYLVLCILLLEGL